MIYDTKLLLGWISEGTSIEVTQVFAADLVEERARELKKVDLWENPWMKFVPNK
jgi:hypothetical protein